MSVLNQVIHDLTSEFAAKLVAVLGTMSVNELVGSGEISVDVRAPTQKKSPAAAVPRKAGRQRKMGKRVRRTSGDIQQIVDRIVSFVQKREGGCTAEQIRIGLGFERKELPRPLKEALAKKLLTKKGEKRATRYFAKPAKNVEKIAKKISKDVEKLARKISKGSRMRSMVIAKRRGSSKGSKMNGVSAAFVARGA